MTPIRTLIPIALVAALAAASPARADTRAVSYADLDLTSPQGQSVLDHRIATAVRQVCGRAYPTDLQSRRQVELCRSATLADIQAQRNDALAQARNDRIQLSAR